MSYATGSSPTWRPSTDAIRRPSPRCSPRTPFSPILCRNLPTSVGRAIATFFENGIAASDGWVFTAKTVHTCAAHVAIDFEIVVETGGGTMTIDGIEVFTTDDDGLFSSVHAYWDDADLTFG